MKRVMALSLKSKMKLTKQKQNRSGYMETEQSMVMDGSLSINELKQLVKLVQNQAFFKVCVRYFLSNF